MENTAYFQCLQSLSDNWGSVLEGEHLNKDLATLNPFLSEYNKINQTRKGQRKAKRQVHKASFNDEQFLAYANLVEEYTTKQLSYESDILNAFEGILQHLFEEKFADCLWIARA